MKTKTLILISAMIFTSTILPSCKEKTKTEANGTKIYECPMHPEVTSEKPGQCPKCGMDLVEKK